MTTSRLPLLYLFLLAGSALVLPHLAHAAIPFWGPLIPPGISASGADSQTCPLGWSALIILANNVVSFLLTVTIAFVAPLVFAYGGFLYLTSGENPGQRSQANTMMQNVVVGIVIALAAWLIVDAVLGVLYNANAPGLNGASWSSLITSGGQDPCMKVAGSLSQSAGATPQPGVSTGGSNNCPGSLICTQGTCQVDPQVDQGDGSAGAACVPSSSNANGNCATGLVCDSSRYCSTAADAAAVVIPSSCNSSASPVNGGSCSAPSDPPCSVPNLTQSCFSTAAPQAAQICQYESGNNAQLPSKADITADGHSYSIGLFQINLTNSYNTQVDGQNCSAAFSQPCQNSGGYSNVQTNGHCSSTVTNLQLYNDCVTSASDPANNISTACSLSSGGSNWCRWKNTANACNVQSC